MNRIYFDNAATTPLDPRVFEAMEPYLRQRFGNPDSRTHPYGWESEEAVAIARESVAALLGASPAEVVFTSGATEADNLAIKGVLRGSPGSHLIVSAVEHSAVLGPAARMERDGWAVTRVPPRPDGRITPEAVEAAIRPETALVSVIHGNNETGVVQPIPEIAEVCRRHRIPFHTDASQSAGKVPCEVDALGVDLLSCSAHKMHGPKGAGALYVRRRPRRIRLVPELDGGGQEGGLRSGTLNVPAIVGFGKACEIARAEMEAEGARIAALRDRLERGILDRVPGASRNGCSQPRLPGISSLRFGSGAPAEALLLGLRGVALSAGSACASAAIEPSHVLLALGLAEEEARSSLRFSLGRFSTAEEVEAVIREVVETVERLRGSQGSG